MASKPKRSKASEPIPMTRRVSHGEQAFRDLQGKSQAAPPDNDPLNVNVDIQQVLGRLNGVIGELTGKHQQLQVVFSAYQENAHRVLAERDAEILRLKTKYEPEEKPQEAKTEEPTA